MYLGDGGSFLFGSIFSLILIEFYLNNPGTISSFFIVLLLWYPAFENLFSIIRKFYLKGDMHFNKEGNKTIAKKIIEDVNFK